MPGQAASSKEKARQQVPGWFRVGSWIVLAFQQPPKN
jgi:hypothetical protein